MFRKMLVCTDLSPASDALVRCAEELRGVGMEEVVLTHVNFMVSTPGVEEVLAEENSPVLRGQKAFLEERGVRVVVEMPLGLPAPAIAEAAERHDVSVILVGTHGRGILQAAALGSVSTQLLQRMRRPVLLTRIALLEDGTCGTVCGGMFGRLLFVTDFSETAERALDYLGKITLDSGCPVTLMHVMELNAAGLPDARHSEENVRFLLEAKMRRLRMLGAADVTIELVHGIPADEIVARTKSGAYSLVVMGGQGKGLIREIFLGSVANQVARLAETPVLFVPAER